MSRVHEVLNRLELVAKKMMLSLEEVLDVLEGKHPTLGVTEKPANPTAPTVEAGGQVSDTLPINSAGETVIAGSPTENPTISGPADASDSAPGQPSADSTEATSPGSMAAEQNTQAAASTEPVEE